MIHRTECDLGLGSRTEKDPVNLGQHLVNLCAAKDGRVHPQPAVHAVMQRFSEVGASMSAA